MTQQKRNPAKQTVRNRIAVSAKMREVHGISLAEVPFDLPKARPGATDTGLIDIDRVVEAEKRAADREGRNFPSEGSRMEGCALSDPLRAYGDGCEK